MSATDLPTGTIPTTRAARHQRISELLERHTVASQGELLTALARDGISVTQATLPRDLVELLAQRARIVLLAAQGVPNTAIAARLGCLGRR